MASTQYNIVMADKVVETRSSKPAALNFAETLASDNPDQPIRVETGAGNVVHEIATNGQQGKTYFKPWTRVEVTDKVTLEVPAGYTVAYVRSRVNALVARANDRSGWLVITPEGNVPAANTAEAREITNSLAAQLKERKAKEKAEKEAAKAAEPVEA